MKTFLRFLITSLLLFTPALMVYAQTAAGKLLYVTTAGRIYTMNADGTGKTQINPSGSDYHPTLNNGDAAVKTRLEALGYYVVVKTATTATSADATGKAVVLVSSTVTPSAVGTKFRTVTVPVVIWEAGLFANMGMTGSTTKDNGTVTKQTQIKITNAGHPLAACLSGTVTVVTASETFTWGKPNANAASIATAAADATKP